MKKKAFGIVLLILAALVLLTGEFLESLLWEGDILALDWYCFFLPTNQSELCCVAT